MKEFQYTITDPEGIHARPAGELVKAAKEFTCSITMEKDGQITLTEPGLEIALRIYNRHRLLVCLLMQLGVSEETARADACRIEHDISEETYAALDRLYRQLAADGE